MAMDTADFLICAILLLLIYAYVTLKNLYSYFERNDIPYVKPIPLLGNTLDWFMARKPLPLIYSEMHRQLDPHPFGGVFVGMNKTLVIRDPELIRSILVKDFPNFQNRHIRNDRGDILSQNLFMMKGEEWKNLRVKLTGLFTSGKMKQMFPMVRDCGVKFNSVLEGLANGEDFLVSAVCSRYTIDITGTCGFGLDINSLDDPNSVFTKINVRTFDVNYVNILRLMFPKLLTLVDHFRDNRKEKEFFAGFVGKMMKYREENGIYRGDFFDTLIRLKDDPSVDSGKNSNHSVDSQTIGAKVEMTFEKMIAQTFLFFSVGFETSSSTLGFLLMELAQNQHIQDKVRDEIRTVLKNNDDQLTYETIKQMKYLNMAIEETLRKYPIGGFLGRECNTPYKIPGSKFIVPEGMPLFVSVRGLHYDKRYYERPNEFYPEHFTEEAKANRPRYTYLPFGDGPRVCIGARFGKMQTKVGAVYALKDFSFHVSPKLTFPIEHSPGSGLFRIKGGNWLRCKKV